jgi:hypothetical protein
VPHVCTFELVRKSKARMQASHGSSRGRRLEKLMPSDLKPAFILLEDALKQVLAGELDPRRGQAASALAGALVRPLLAGELEERVRRLEESVE